MAIVPLKQYITIRQPVGSGVTEFDTPAMGEPYARKCRFVETVSLVKSLADGREVVSKAQVMFDKYEPISEHTELTFTPESRVPVTHKPLSIAVKRHITGKPLLTIVYV